MALHIFRLSASHQEGWKMGRWLVLIGLLQCGAFAQTHPIPVNIKGMDDHIGQLLKARLVETPAGIQRAETTITSIGLANFQLVFTGQSGIAYDLDLFVDVDGNKAYSVPPLDHAWRQPIPVVHHGDALVTFNHTASYTDIKYPTPGVSVRFVTGSGREAASGEARILITPLSNTPHESVEGFTLLGARASGSSRKILVLPGIRDQAPR